MRTGPTNYTLKGVINTLEKAYRKNKAPILGRIVEELTRSTRQRRNVNLSKINRYSAENANVIVAGKVLGSGELKHKVNIIALSYSKSAEEKLKASKSDYKTMKEWAAKPAIPKEVVLLG